MLTPTTYIFSYKATDKNGKILKEGRTKAKNMYSEFEAFSKFEDYLKKDYPALHKLNCFNVTTDTIIGEMPTNAKDFMDMLFKK